jgi:hypothetical protein
MNGWWFGWPIRDPKPRSWNADWRLLSDNVFLIELGNLEGRHSVKADAGALCWEELQSRSSRCLVLNIWWRLCDGPHAGTGTRCLNSRCGTGSNRTDLRRREMCRTGRHRLAVCENLWCSRGRWCRAVGLRDSPFVMSLEEDRYAWKGWPSLAIA